MDGNWGNADAESESKPINYLWGLSAGVVDLILSEKVPKSIKRLVEHVKEMVMEEKLHIFGGELIAQDGEVITGEDEELEIDDIIKMDWLMENVEGAIPVKEELKEKAQPIVEMKGVLKESEN
jgi:hypothetical protein